METCSGDVVKVEEVSRRESGQRGLGVDGAEAMKSWVASHGNAGLCALPVPMNRTTIHAPSNGIFEEMVMKERLFWENKMQGPVKVDIRKNCGNKPVNVFSPVRKYVNGRR